MIIQRAKGTSTLSAIPDTIKVIAENTPPIASILDVGCGEGIYGMLLKSLFRNKVDVRGMDVNTYSMVHAIYDKFYPVSMEDFIITDKTFDMAIILHVLEHLEFAKAMKVIERVKTIADSIVIGLPLSRQGHLYKQSKDPDSHKWGVSEFKYSEYGFTKCKSPFNLYLWKKEI